MLLYSIYWNNAFGEKSRVAPGNQKILSGGNLYLILIYKERVAAQKVPKRKNNKEWGSK
jgi:hypothetical protein